MTQTRLNLNKRGELICPYCQSKFYEQLDDDRFVCEFCGKKYRILRQDRKVIGVKQTTLNNMVDELDY